MLDAGITSLKGMLSLSFHSNTNLEYKQMPSECPVCNTELKVEPSRNPPGRDAKTFSCPRCGNFVLSDTLIACLPDILQKDKDAVTKISHALRTMQRINEKVELSNHNIDAILKTPLPRPKEQADLLIRWFAEQSSDPGNIVRIDTPIIDPNRISSICSIIGAKSIPCFNLVLNHLIKIHFVKVVTTDDMRSNSYQLTFEGWNHYETLLKGGATYHKAFMAMKFGDSDLNNVLENVFKPSVKMAGFELFKLDDEPRAGLIDDRLRVEIQSSDFLIADLTHGNFGAYWEAGYAEGLGKPVIYTCEQEIFNTQKTHFDTNHHLTVIWDKNAPAQAGELLKATIRATLPQLAKLDD